uniref:Uncharacterized protein n=1 Tax=Pristionchus pacificus TaxID=54126 RepID=A0A8R1UP46_PRIPA
MILDFEAFSNELIWLRFECPERYANYLGLNDSQVISKNNGVHKVDCIINYDEKLVRRLKRFFGRISHIPRLELVFENSSSKPALEFMKIAMRGMIIDTSSIFNFIRGDTVCCLIIDDVSAIGQGQSSPFFVELLRLIESVEIFAETAEYEDWMKLRDGFHPDRLIHNAELTASCSFGTFTGAGGCARMTVNFLNRKKG